ncbi:MAG: hypothetical protein U5R14_14205 [Gemmatimonadota bacterium]|nr:hypothetical protein [Gemmatimonadota bacterium]
MPRATGSLTALGRLGLSVAATTVVTACAFEAESLPVECRVTRSGSVTAADTLYVDFELQDPLGPGADLRAMVRVDPLDEIGTVEFSGSVPPSTAAVSATLIPGDAFYGCLGEAPERVRLRAPRTPHGRAWIRVSADRPVTVRLHPNHRPPDSAPTLTVLPGTSAETRWSRRSEP